MISMQSAAHVELSEVVDRRTVERAWIRAKEAQRANRRAFAEKGMRAAHARDPKLLKALEQAAEVLTAMNEEQLGQTQRGVTATMAERSVPTEVSLVREAYRLADEGHASIHFAWIYGAAAELAGL